MKTQVVHGLPVAAGYVLSTAGYGARLHRGAPARRRRSSSRGGTSSERPRAARSLRLAARCSRWRLAVGLQVGARRRLSARRARRPSACSTCRPAPRCERIALEFDALAADVYWIRAIQHYGGDRLSRDGRGKYELLHPLLDLTTTLDPYFTIAYRFGAIFLSEAPPGGPGRPDQAIALLEKGIAAQPQKWQYFHDIAFVHYWHLHDPATAAIWFQRAADQPDAPNWLRPLAATMLSARDRSVGARPVAADPAVRPAVAAAARRERSLLAARRRSIRSTSCRRSSRTPRCRPAGASPWSDLVRRGCCPGTPVDPTGTPYPLDPDTGRGRRLATRPRFARCRI